jgi:murein DD-endopeptidase MepM/ murein hydrolase activator NlpD
VKFIRLATVLFVGLILIGLFRHKIEPILTLPFPTIRLLTKPPDAHLSMPLRHLQPREIANTWHSPRSGGRRHQGQDLFAPRGTPVYSATEGIVIRIGPAGIGGNAVSVWGAGGRVYYYAHLSKFAEQLRAGDEVTTQTVLGYVGNTGNARTTPSHLHFGVYGPSGALNPLPLLRAPDRTG